MARIVLVLVAVLHGIAAAFMWAAPGYWYETTPGVAMTGPLNVHFVRDVALAFGLSAVAILWGVMNRDRTALWFGCGFPAAHAAYHLVMWVGRGVPLDQVAVVNLLGIQLPAWVAIGAIVLMTRQEDAA